MVNRYDCTLVISMGFIKRFLRIKSHRDKIKAPVFTSAHVAEGGTSVFRRGGKRSAAFGAASLRKHTFSVGTSHPFKSHVNKEKAPVFTGATGAEGGT